MLLAVGVLIAVAAPIVWSSTHRDPALQTIDSGVAVRLAQAGASASDLDPTVRIPASTRATQAPVSTTPVRPTKISDGFSTASGPTSTVPSHTGKVLTDSSPVPVRSGTAPRSSPAARDRVSNVSPAPATSTVITPVRLEIPAIGVNAPVESVGVDERGEMAIPEQVDQVGWYRFGAAPGSQAGSVVMSGHIDSAQQGLGAFAHLGDLRAGDMVSVMDGSGRTLKYRVIGKEAFAKTSVPLPSLFSRQGTARLTLITCGGAFDSTARSYLDNIVVTAVPA